MTALRHLPMGLMWTMPVPVACSLAVAGEGLAVTCGQCPLDGDGAVLFPGDASAQAGLVARMVAGVLRHLPGMSAALLVVYHDCADPAEVLGPLAAAFPDAALAPVRLPHFYYPGMRIEVDAYATAAPPLQAVSTSGPARLVRIEGGPLTFLHLAAPDMPMALPLLQGVDPAQLLSAQWFADDPPPATLDLHPPGRVIPPGGGVAAVLTLAPGPVMAGTTAGGAVLRRSGRFAWAAAAGTAPDLARAAHQAMDAIALPLPGYSPLKATTHYAGGPGPADLHGNLAVRHARFPRPGPASTGVPVSALAGSTLAIDLLAILDSPDAMA